MGDVIDLFNDRADDERATFIGCQEIRWKPHLHNGKSHIALILVRNDGQPHIAVMLDPVAGLNVAGGVSHLAWEMLDPNGRSYTPPVSATFNMDRVMLGNERVAFSLNKD